MVPLSESELKHGARTEQQRPQSQRESLGTHTTESSQVTTGKWVAQDIEERKSHSERKISM